MAFVTHASFAVDRPTARRLRLAGGEAGRSGQVRALAGEVESVTSRVTLKIRASALGLEEGEKKARAWLPRVGGLE